MSFTYSTNPPSRDSTKVGYALWKVRSISRDIRENPPYSLTDEEWIDFLEDTRKGIYYQPYLAVSRAISTNPERLQSISEASGSYTFQSVEQTVKALKQAQTEDNKSLGLSLKRVIPTGVVW